MKKRLFAMLMASALAATALAGCGANGSNDTNTTGDTTAADSSASSGGDYNISVILKTTSAEYWRYVQAGAEQYAKEHPEVTVAVKGATSETAYDEQQNIIETDLNNASIDALIIAPLQADAVTTFVAGSNKTILAVDTDFDAPEKVTFVGTGNEAAAALGGRTAVEAAKKAGWDEIKCIEISGVQGDSTNTARLTGYMQGVNEVGGEFLENETQYANAVADQAVNCMEAIMQTHPEGIAIICANNDDMAMAAARAAKGNAAYKDTIFLGFNGDRVACEAILNGELTMSVVQDAYGMGYKAVESAVAALNGEKLDDFVESTSSIVDIDSAQERLDTLKSYLS